MSRYPGGIIRKTPVTPAGPFQNGAAPGVWTLAEASFWTKQGLWPIAGNEQLVVEDVFSTWLYTGNSSTQTITNGINLSGQGGLVWLKARNSAENNFLFDTNRGVQKRLISNSTADEFELSDGLSAFNSNGFTLGSGYTANGSGLNVASWTFRQAPKFFDVVTYTGNGSIRTIAHNLGVAPGMIIIKSISEANIWVVYHRSIGATKYMVLNVTQGESTYSPYFNNTEPTASVFTLGNDNSDVNKTGTQFVAYLFAHVTGSDGIIQCGSFTTDGSGYANVNLGYEPQWIMYKPSNSTGSWGMGDVMRGMPASTTTTGAGNSAQRLFANTSSAEGAETNYVCNVNSTGFTFHSGGYPSSTFIYMAIRRGPMRTPTLGTSVFSPVTYTGTGSARTITTGFVTDLVLGHGRRDDLSGTAVADRLRGDTRYLETSATSAEATSDGTTQDITGFDFMTGYGLGVPNNSWMNNAGSPGINWNFRRAPGFMDVVCYTGTGVARTVTHNLGVAPELMIVKRRETTGSWIVGTTFGATTFTEAVLNSSDAGFFISYDNLINAAPTSTTFSVGSSSGTNGGGSTYVAYLFASAPGVSKVGSYTGNGSSQTINCAFTTGARFVMIKRADSTGGWLVWDSARGIVAGNDPYLALNSTAAEVTTNDSVDTDNTGFIVNQVGASNINVNAATYIFLAIA
jgi:hypothetical protein